MDAFKRNFLRHALAVGQWMTQHGAQGAMDPVSLELDITCNGRTHHFWPFVMQSTPGGALGFASSLGPNVVGFVSWRPYRKKEWPIAQDKLDFKAFALAHGVATPEHALASLEVPFLVKSRRSSLGGGQRGPFAGGAAVRLYHGEYCERFIFGSLLKAWFWNETLLAVEVVDMPVVTGDGAQTLRQLIGARLGPDTPWPARIRDLALLQGFQLDAVIPASRHVLADYQYMSPLNPSITADYNVRARLVGTPLEQQLVDAARACVLGIPEEIRPDTVCSLDAVVDGHGKAWFLEVNCNPLLHPACYAGMLDALFSTA